jgi:hypothetical protein
MRAGNNDPGKPRGPFRTASGLFTAGVLAMAAAAIFLLTR